MYVTDNAISKLYLTKLLSCSLNLIQFLFTKTFLIENTLTFFNITVKLFCPGTQERGNANFGKGKNKLQEHEAKSEERGMRRLYRNARPPLIKYLVNTDTLVLKTIVDKKKFIG